MTKEADKQKVMSTYRRRTIKLVLEPLSVFFNEPTNWSNPETRQIALKHWTNACRRYSDEIITEAVDTLINKRAARSFPAPGNLTDIMEDIRKRRVPPIVPKKTEATEPKKDPEHEMYVELWKSLTETEQETLRGTLWDIFKVQKPETKEGALPFFNVMACSFFSQLCRAGKLNEIAKLSGVQLQPKQQ